MTSDEKDSGASFKPQAASFEMPYLAALMPEARSVPLRRARSFIRKKITGVTRRTWIVEVTIPPTMGAAIGRMTSEPVPDDRRSEGARGPRRRPS